MCGTPFPIRIDDLISMCKSAVLVKRWWEWTNPRMNRTRTISWRETFLLSKLSLRFNKIQSKPWLKKKKKLRGEKSQRKSVIGENDQRLGAPGKVSRAGQPRALGDAAHQNPGRACLARVPRGFDPAITDRPTQLRGCLISGTCGRGVSWKPSGKAKFWIQLKLGPSQKTQSSRNNLGGWWIGNRAQSPQDGWGPASWKVRVRVE